MKFTIEIELKNGDYCNGCPLLLHGGCRKYGDLKRECKNYLNYWVRPEICKQNEEKDNA